MIFVKEYNDYNDFTNFLYCVYSMAEVVDIAAGLEDEFEEPKPKSKQQ